MEVLILLVFISITLVTAGVLFFVWSVRERTMDHADRLALRPLDEDAPPVGTAGAEGSVSPRRNSN